MFPFIPAKKVLRKIKKRRTILIKLSDSLKYLNILIYIYMLFFNLYFIT